MLDGANNILAQNFNQLTEEYSRLLIQIINDEANIEKRKARLNIKVSLMADSLQLVFLYGSVMLIERC